MRPKVVKNYKFVRSSGTQMDWSQKWHQHPGTGESGFLKDSRQAFFGREFSGHVWILGKFGGESHWSYQMECERECQLRSALKVNFLGKGIANQ